MEAPPCVCVVAAAASGSLVVGRLNDRFHSLISSSVTLGFHCAALVVFSCSLVDGGITATYRAFKHTHARFGLSVNHRQNVGVKHQFAPTDGWTEGCCFTQTVVAVK